MASRKHRKVSVVPTETTRDMLRELIPLDTIVTDLWNSDIHFEDYTFADSFFDIALGPEDVALMEASALKEDFLRWVQEYDMDYAQEQWDSTEEFEGWVLDQCVLFIRKWRSNIAARFVG